MIAKQVIRAVLIIVVLGGLAVWANREFQKNNSITGAAAEKVWDLLDDPEGYRAYLAGTIRIYLGK